MTNRKITNDNLYLLLPGKVSHFVRIYTEKQGGSMLDALRIFYHSDTYKALEKEETKYWHYGPVALYEDFMQKANKLPKETNDENHLDCPPQKTVRQTK